MIETNYGLLPERNLYNYLKYLINKIYKILPLKEEGATTYKAYLDGIMHEMIGTHHLISILENEPRFLAILSTLQYLVVEDYPISVCRREVFKCIHLLEDLSNSIFRGAYG